MSSISIFVKTPRGFEYEFCQTTQKCRLSLFDSISFIAQLDVEEVQGSREFHELAKWQRKLIHNARIKRFATNQEVTLAEEEASVMSDEDFEYDDELEEGTVNRFVYGVWKEVPLLQVNEYTAFRMIEVDEARYYSLEPLEKTIARAVIGQQYGRRAIIYHDVYVQSKSELLRSLAFKENPVYWPTDEEEEPDPIFPLPPDVEEVKQLISNDHLVGIPTDLRNDHVSLENMEQLCCDHMRRMKEINLSLVTEIIEIMNGVAVKP